MTPTVVSAALLIALSGELALAGFLIFGERRLAWHRRVMGAGFAVTLGIVFVTLVAAAVQGRLDSVPPIEPGPAVGLFLLVNYLGFQTIFVLRNVESRPSCLGLVGRGVGCIVVAWLGFAAVVLGIAVLMGLTAVLSR